MQPWPFGLSPNSDGLVDLHIFRILVRQGQLFRLDPRQTPLPMRALKQLSLPTEYIWEMEAHTHSRLLGLDRGNRLEVRADYCGVLRNDDDTPRRDVAQRHSSV